MQATIPSCLFALLPEHPVVLADAGAAGGIHERWSILDQGLRVLGFEPDQRAFDILPQQDDRVWINAALTDREGNATLLVTRHQTNTSLLPPNRHIVDRIYQSPSDFDVVKEVIVPCTTLDAASRAAKLDVTALKADTQGTELAILQGAERCLRETLLVVELEVEFTPLYSGQPLFADVDAFMRERGFMLFDLGNLLCHKWRRSHRIGGHKGQLLAADALYFRTPESLFQFAGATQDRVALLARYWAVCAAYGYTDLAFEVALDQFDMDGLPLAFKDGIMAWAEAATKKSMFQNVRGRGRAASWLHSLPEQLDADSHSRWINPLGSK
jgi:FkbM family methyltransferase